MIKPVDKDWEDLQITFSYSFKNLPYEFHNGGLWPMITGFYVADLAQRGETDKASDYLSGIHCANAMVKDEQPWGFPEYVNGSVFSAGGNRHQCWSASAALMGHYALKGKMEGNDLELQLPEKQTGHSAPPSQQVAGDPVFNGRQSV